MDEKLHQLLENICEAIPMEASKHRKVDVNTN
jgi:hypothetical protein